MTDLETQRTERQRFRALVVAELTRFADYDRDQVVRVSEIHDALLRIKDGINPDKRRTRIR